MEQSQLIKQYNLSPTHSVALISILNFLTLRPVEI